MNSSLFLSSLMAIVCLVLVTEAKQPTKWKCDTADAKQMDTIVAQIMTYGRSDRKFPVNKDELRKYCKEQTNFVSRLEDYKSQCLKSRPKQLVSVIIYSIKSLINQYCKNPGSKKAKDLISSAVCANQASFDYKKCDEDFTDMLLANLEHKDSKKQLAQMCCGYIEIFKCVRTQAIPHKECSDSKTVDTNVNYIRGFFDNSINIVCGDYNESTDKCDKVKIERKKNSKKSRPVSYFTPLVKLLANL